MTGKSPRYPRRFKLQGPFFIGLAVAGGPRRRKEGDDGCGEGLAVELHGPCDGDDLRVVGGGLLGRVGIAASKDAKPSQERKGPPEPPAKYAGAGVGAGRIAHAHRETRK